MSNDDLIKKIGGKLGLPIKEVEIQREIPYSDAITQFLPPYLQDRLLEKVQEIESRQYPEERASDEIAFRGELTRYESEFRQTDEGRIWYECNFPLVLPKSVPYRGRGGVKRVPKKEFVVGGPPRNNRKY